jgi:hypothetical protein
MGHSDFRRIPELAGFFHGTTIRGDLVWGDGVSLHIGLRVVCAGVQFVEKNGSTLFGLARKICHRSSRVQSMIEAMTAAGAVASEFSDRSFGWLSESV